MPDKSIVKVQNAGAQKDELLIMAGSGFSKFNVHPAFKNIRAVPHKVKYVENGKMKNTSENNVEYKYF